MADLLVIVPTRSRPESVAKVVEAWRATGAFDDGAELLFVVDADDPKIDGYGNAIRLARGVHPGLIRRNTLTQWKPLVPKLNSTALGYAGNDYFALGFAGDDHLPRTKGWAKRYVEQLRDMGTGIVYCDDGYRQDIPTQWAMTSDIVQALGRMVPAPVDHLYCDDAIGALGETAGCLAFLPDVVIEHMNPYAGGKAPMDEQYERVNGAEQYRNDRAAYRLWKRSGQLAADADAVRRLCIGKGNA